MQIFNRIVLCAALVLLSVVAPDGSLAADADQLFGSRISNVHPSLTLNEEYTDNYREVDSGEESEWTTTISPQLLLALPGIEGNFFIENLNTVPGGAAASYFMGDAETGYQGVLLYRADIEYHANDPDDDVTNHAAQGLLQYAFPFGLTLQASNAYTVNYDDFSVAGNERAEYDGNRFAANAHYKVGEKLSMQAGYAHYSLKYDDTDKSFQERSDDSLTMSVFYQVLPKTQFFVEYERIDVDYDEHIVPDYSSDNYFAGLRFDATAKLQGYVKAGYGVVDTDVAGEDDYDDFVFEGSLNYRFFSGSNLTLSGRREVNTTVDQDHENVLATEGNLAFSHYLTHKLLMIADAGYRREDYRVDESNDDRKDDIVSAGVSLDYALRDWLNLELNYYFLDRDSDVDNRDYQSNTVVAGVRCAF